ncbi:MAG TPA: hypothetical protein VFL61_09670 [Gaiellaceae bacterium]|nr:hypothetical protein [Gaiellaceae bacterium]
MSGADAEPFEDGQVLWQAICDHKVEGVVAKRVDRPYPPGERGWVKVKNRDYWRYELEREHVIQSPALIRAALAPS